MVWTQKFYYVSKLTMVSRLNLYFTNVGGHKQPYQSEWPNHGWRTGGMKSLFDNKNMCHGRPKIVLPALGD
jgi:hypothetical protein